jgi:hypothetical protein
MTDRLCNDITTNQNFHTTNNQVDLVPTTVPLLHHLQMALWIGTLLTMLVLFIMDSFMGGWLAWDQWCYECLAADSMNEKLPEATRHYCRERVQRPTAEGPQVLPSLEPLLLRARACPLLLPFGSPSGGWGLAAMMGEAVLPSPQLGYRYQVTDLLEL